jgi:hypothetical protein
MTMLIALLTLACNDKNPQTDDSLEPVDCSTRPIELPSPRGEAAGVWDASNSRVVFFGGDAGWPTDCIPQTEFSAETWAFHTDCDNFQRIEGATWPEGRGRHAVALDEANGRMILTGGRTRSGTSGDYTLLDDAWAFDFATDTWTQIATGGPKARNSHSLVVAGGQALLYGGNTSKSGTSYKPQADLWSLDLATNTWTELESDADAGERLFHAAAVSPDGGTMYVYAGADENALLGPFFRDLWAYDIASATWTELSDGKDGPKGRIWPSIFADDSSVYVWAGHDDKKLGNTNELWTFDLASGAWTQLTEGDVHNNDANGFCDFPADFVEPDLDAPERRYAHVGAWTGEGFVTFGGKTDCGIINDAWTWSSADGWHEASTATAGEICLRAFAECDTMCF